MSWSFDLRKYSLCTILRAHLRLITTIHKGGVRLECREKKTSFNYNFLMGFWSCNSCSDRICIFTGVALTIPFPYNILTVINSAMIGVIEIFVGALIDMHS